MGMYEMTSEQLVEYKNRFSAQNWAKIDGGKKVEYLCKRLSLLDDENQKNLVLDLTDNFEYVEILNFIMELKESLEDCVRQSRLSEKDNVLVAPLKAPFIDLKNFKKSPNGELLFSKSKSPDMVYPLLKNYLTDETLLDTINFCDDPSLVVKKFKSEACVIVLVDDFVGTGQTAKTHIDAYMNLLNQYNLQCTYADFCVVVDIAMKLGVDYLSTFGIECYSKRLRVRGISDDKRYSANQIRENIKLMRQIEHEILCNLNRKYSLGFVQSESLVSIMNKAPNNTFPFYWEKCTGDVKPIFRRYYE